MIGEIPVQRVRVPVFKVKGGHDALFVVRSEEVFGFHAHWLGTRSYMCPGTDCSACEQFVGSRWHGFLAVDLCVGSGGELRHGLLEITESAYGRLQFLRNALGRDDFVGLRVCASRRSSRSPLRLEQPEEGCPVVEATRAVGKPFIASATATIYGLPSPGDGEPLSLWEVKAAEAARLMLGKVMAKLAIS